jgi:hypothetical protein
MHTSLYKKENIKYLVSSVWIIFLTVFWNSTIKIVSNYYSAYTNNTLPEFVGMIAFSMFLVLFICPLLIGPLCSTLFKMLILDQDVNPSAEYRYYSLIKGVARGLNYLLQFLVLFTFVHYAGTDYLKSWLPNFTPAFQDNIINYHASIAETGLLYFIITAIPIGIANFLPKIFFMIAVFISELPVLSSIVMLASIFHRFVFRLFHKKTYLFSK